MDNKSNPELIFLISQPRAGSTLLQKLLAGHSEISTTSEPWIMLHASSVFRPGAIKADYDAELAALGFESFLQALPHGRQSYVEAMHDMYGSLYAQVLQNAGGRIFLDKTPRYYLIIPQLQEVFPQAKIILLIRNPLAVLVSIIRTWTGIAPGSLAPYKHDLMTAPRLLAASLRANQGNLLVVQYENLLANPEAELQKICDSLQINFQKNMLEYDADAGRKWTLGDQDKVYKQGAVDQANDRKWINSVNEPAIWRLCSDYVESIGEETFAELGYDWAETAALLLEHRPPWFKSLASLPLGQAVGGNDKNIDNRTLPQRLHHRILRSITWRVRPREK